MKNKVHFLFVLLQIAVFSLSAFPQDKKITAGAERTDDYLPLLKGKQVAVVCNQTSIIGDKIHLIDTLASLNVNTVKIFSPEHGFKGNNSEGKEIKDDIYYYKGREIPVISLYGKKKKPAAKDFENTDIVIFDIQDVGCRFYTYISTLYLIMEACAENSLPLIVLDRPNPNNYLAGCVLKDTNLVSFVGMFHVPICYNLTIGEFAMMINGEHWLGTSTKRVIGEKGNLHCELTVIPCDNYSRHSDCNLPIPPSPNLQTMTAFRNYPALCLFEGTPVSVGRGTDKPFEMIGYPAFTYEGRTIKFTPHSKKDIADNPMYNNQLCNGLFVSKTLNFGADGGISCCFDTTFVADTTDEDAIIKRRFIPFILEFMYETYPQKDRFFATFFDKLAGTKDLKRVITGEIQFSDIGTQWQQDLLEYAQIRQKYLLYD
jgi:uncharacterized protein YbbC (DUF1343 family)